MPSLLGSLLLAALLAFVTPVLLLASLLVAFSGASYIPGVACLGAGGTASIVQFLRIFGINFLEDAVKVYPYIKKC